MWLLNHLNVQPIPRYRLAAGLSQEALAARARLSARTISDIELAAAREWNAGTRLTQDEAIDDVLSD